MSDNVKEEWITAVSNCAACTLAPKMRVCEQVTEHGCAFNVVHALGIKFILQQEIKLADPVKFEEFCQKIPPWTWNAYVDFMVAIHK